MQCVYNRMTTMSKLKRKKLSVEESRSEQHSRIKKSNESLCTVQDSSCSKTSTGRERWWESSELSDVERLWALTLRALCPALQSDQEEPIPQLPPPSSTKTPVQKVSDWRWCNADEDANPPPDLPAPSFLTHPQPVNDCKNPSHPPAAENMGESDPPPLADQENYISSPDQESVSVCDIQTTQQHHLEVCGVEGRKLSDKQGDKFGEAGKVSEMQELTIGSGAGLDADSRAGGSGAGLDADSRAGGSGAGLGVESRAGGSGAGLNEGSRAEGSGTGLNAGSRAGGSGAGLNEGSRAGGSGTGLNAGSRAGGSGTGLNAGSRAGGSGTGLNAGSRAGGSGTGKGIKTGAGGSGSGLGTIPGTEASASGMGIKQKAGVSGSGQRANPGAGGSGTGQRANSGVRGSGLGLGTKSGAGQGAKSGLEGSGSGLERNSEAVGSGLGQGKKSGPEGSGAVSGSGLECCPMCLMSFPEGCFAEQQLK
ncbi:keratin, type I cytoskeletal 9 isoform X2 [Megalobrama amblycephala]|uniref:keratin, type I cytoskeletal 9 isoform X2 n=1 Tax=Megalobrama amblycephala TaxID=75352 RepID=UPI0020146FEE|nr:keratin, type I cytoskeletal 9 isoform X2 [Megalobrama amblycephala]